MQFNQGVILPSFSCRKAGKTRFFAVKQGVRSISILALSLCLFACGGSRYRPATAQRVPVQNATPDVTHQALLYGISQVRGMQVRTNSPAMVIAQWGNARRNFIVRFDIEHSGFTTQLVQSTALSQRVGDDGRVYIHRRYHNTLNQISRYADSFLRTRGAYLEEPQDAVPHGMGPPQDHAQVTSVGGGVTGGTAGTGTGTGTGTTTPVGTGGSQECLNGEADPIEAEQALSSISPQLGQCLASTGVQLAVSLVVAEDGNVNAVLVSGDISDDERICLEASLLTLSLSPPQGGCAEHHTVLSF